MGPIQAAGKEEALAGLALAVGFIRTRERREDGPKFSLALALGFSNSSSRKGGFGLRVFDEGSARARRARAGGVLCWRCGRGRAGTVVSA